MKFPFHVSLNKDILLVNTVHLRFKQARKKSVNFLKLRTELKTNFSLLGRIVSDLKKVLWTVIHPKPLEHFPLFQRWELGLSISYQPTYSLIKLVLNCHTNWPYTSWGQYFFLQINQFWLCAVWWATVNHCKSCNGSNAIKLWNGSKNCLFLANSENLNGSSLQPIT